MEITIAQFDVLLQFVPGVTDKEHENTLWDRKYMWAET